MEPDLTLVERRLALYDREWDLEALEETVENLRTEWERDLRPLLPQFVPYEVAQERVESLLNWLPTPKSEEPLSFSKEGLPTLAHRKPAS